MSTIVRCSCGASLRIAPELAGKPVRCPKCRSSLRAPAAEPAVSADAQAGAMSATSPSAMPGRYETQGESWPHVYTAGDAELTMTCPICLSAIEREQLVHRCPECDIVHHEECWLEVGGCGTFGCKQAPSVDKSEQSAQAPLTAWGDTKDCPICGEKIKSIALRCRYCGSEFDTVDPLSAADLRRQYSVRQKTGQFKNIVVGTFIASLAGCLAPFALILGLAYLVPRRAELQKAGPMITTLAWTSIAISSVWCVLMLVFYFLSL